MKNLALSCYLFLSFFTLEGQKKDILFSLLDSKKTGVDFNNKITDTKDANILIYANFYGGAGVGVGDFNLDGKQDLFFAGNQVPDRLYLNQGDLTFKDITKSANIKDSDGWSSGVLIADINADSYPDIYITRELYDENPERRRNKLYINQGNLKFKEMSEEYGVDDPGRTRHATFLDYNKDGLLDLFLLTQPPNTGNYSSLKGIDLSDTKFSPKLLKNTGEKFVDVTKEAGLLRSGFPNSVTAADLNQDGWTDLYVTNDFDAPDFLYINKGDGTFEDQIQDAVNHISFYSMGIDAADLTNNGLLDVMVLDMVAEDNFRLKANMSGMDVSAFWKVVDDGGHFQYMFNTLHMNHGNNIFSEVGQMAGISSTDWSWSNLLADFDNDGWKDIHVTNGLRRDIRNTDGEKEFSKYVVKVINEYIKENPDNPDVTIWDVLDLKEALKIIPSQKIPNYSYKNLGEMNFENTSEKWGLNQSSFSNGSSYADLDNDGDLDLIVSNINETAYIYENKLDGKADYLRVQLKDSNGATTFGTKLTINTSEGLQYFETTNVRGMYSSSEDIVHFGLKKGTTVESLEITWPDGSYSSIDTPDINQVLTVTKSEMSASSQESHPVFSETILDGLDFRHSENIFDDYKFQILLPHKMSQMGPALATGDVNGDKLEDIYIGGAAGQPSSLYFQNPDGSFRKDLNKRWASDKIYEDVDAAFFDFENDGDLDLYVVSGGNVAEAGSKFYLDRMYMNNGDGRFFRANLIPQFSASGSVVRPSDFDGDGDIDLFVGGRHIPHDYPSPATSTLLVNDGGRYSDQAGELIPQLNEIGMVTDAIWSDFDSDGDQDLIIVGEWMSVKVFENKDGKFRESNWGKDLSDDTGWLFSIEQVDLDDDNDPDYIVGNLGLNYKYKATYSEPFDVYYHDFDDSGVKDIVLGYYNGGEHFPVRGRSCSSQQVPSIGQKFDTYTNFASSTLEEIYGIDQVDDELYLDATNFSHYILRNNGSGFTMEALPRMSQLSSVNDWVKTDINNDGIIDLIGAGGIYQAEIETQRNDASVGVVLLGNGKSFHVMPFEESELYLKSDVKKLSLLKVNGKEVLLIGNNNASVEAFQWNPGNIKKEF